MPEFLGIARQRKLRLGVVHHDDVPHARRGGAAADGAGFHDHNLQAGRRAFRCAGGAHYASTGDGYVVGCAHAP